MEVAMSGVGFSQIGQPKHSHWIPPKIDVLVPHQHADTISLATCIIPRKMTATLGISENGQQEKTPKTMAVKKSPIIGPNKVYSRTESAENRCFSASAASMSM